MGGGGGRKGIRKRGPGPLHQERWRERPMRMKHLWKHHNGTMPVHSEFMRLKTIHSSITKEFTSKHKFSVVA